MVDFTEIGKVNEITDGTMKGVKVGEKDILFARLEGKYYAVSGRCPHMKAYLSKGMLAGTILTCPMHGSQFDLKTGKVVRWLSGSGSMFQMGKLMSALGIAAKTEKPLDIYEVQVEGDRILANIPK